MFDFSIVTQWFDHLLRFTLGLGDFWSILIECVVVGVIILTAYALIAIALIFMERKSERFVPTSSAVLVRCEWATGACYRCLPTC